MAPERVISAIGTEAVIADKRGQKERKTGRDGAGTVHLCTYVHQNKLAKLWSPSNSCTVYSVCLGCVITQSKVRNSVVSGASGADSRTGQLGFGVCH